MSEDPTRKYDASNPNAGYDWDFEDEEKPREGPRLLWGRILALVVALLLVFFLGRTTAPAGSSDEEVQDLRDQVAELEAEVDTLRTEAAAASDEPASPSPSESATGGVTGGESETYVLQSGDTLNTIAEDQYGDVGLADVIAEANGITDPSQLSVGDELEIPPAP